MKILNYLLLILCVGLIVVGCAHCSRTQTHFDGKTKGINPYGDGQLIIDRDSYWGNQNCIMTLMEMTDNATN